MKCQIYVKYLKKPKWHPYKVTIAHELTEDNPDCRLEFCENIMERCNADADFVRWIMFSDKETFCLNVSVNKQNWR